MSLRNSCEYLAPLSFAQERLWFLDQLGLVGAAYNVPGAFRLQGQLNVGALQRSFSELVKRHESLRTRFETIGGEVTQVIDPVGEFRLQVDDLSQLPEEEREAEARRRRQEEIEQPFDLARGPLFRVSLLRLGSEDQLLLMTMHHIISDGWSVGVMLRELGTLYASVIEGRSAQLPQMPIQYADYAEWQREWLSGEVLEKQLEYWRGRLEGAPILELPSDRPRPAAPSFKGKVTGLALSRELTARLEKLALAEGATLYMALLAGTQALLGRWSGQHDIVVGSPIAGRTYRETEGLIGCFVNMLALRTDLGGRPSFRELLRRVKEVTLGAYAHQDIPFEKIVAELQPERDLSRQPLFQVVFTLQNLPQEELKLPALRLRPMSGLHPTAKFDLTIDMKPGPSGLHGNAEYATDLFDSVTIERLLDHWKRLLEGVAANPESAVWELPILSGQERRQLLEEWIGVEIEYPAESCAHELFAQQARQRPDGIALVCGDEQVSYGELERRSNQLGHHLRAMGVGPEMVVGLCVERSVEMMVAMLGILKAGGAYLPLDPSYPTERLRYMLEDTETPVVVTQGELKELLSFYEGEKVCLDQEWEAIAGEPECEVGSWVMAENLAYVIYTSGSTGRPKGVAIEHASAVAFLEWVGRSFSVEELSGVVASTSVCFDLSVYELFGPLAWGGKALMVKDALEIPTLAAANQSTLINTVPSAIAELVRNNDLPSSVRIVNLAGEPLSEQTVTSIYRKSQVKEVNNLYGPTEYTTYATRARALPNETPTIGRPIANTQIYALDKEMQPAPIRVVGELFIGGAGLARGYRKRADQTAERFVPNPFGEAGSRLYRTGDLARYRPDGNIEYLGRADHQVKIRGYRIEPGEVEAALRENPEIQETAVVAREEASGDKRLIGYVVWREGKVGDAGELRKYLKRRLPDYMLPSALVALERLPLTVNGKVDRKALPAPEGRPEGVAYVTARTPVEEMLTGIWEEALRVERIGVHDNFFELGGDSLLATRAAAQICNWLKIEMPVWVLFEGPTIAELAECIEEMQRTDTGLTLPPLMARPRVGPVALSFAQERLWFLERLGLVGSAYNMPAAFRLQGRLDARALERSLAELVRRHENLRTRFETIDGEGAQVIDPPGAFRLEVVDLSQLPEQEREAEALRRRQAEIEQPFDLTRGPLFRVSLLRLGSEDHLLLMTMHHIISDGWSIGIMIRELGALYAGFIEGRPARLPELEAQYADYAVWQREWLSGEVLEKQLSYWKENLEGAPVLELPTDRPRPATPSFKGAAISFELSAELTAGLKKLGREEGATLYMALLAALEALLGRWSGQQDFVVGSPIAGRRYRETEGLIGFFVNMLALRVDLGGRPSFRELLGRVKEVTLGAYGRQDMPFERLVAELQPQRDLSRQPLFQVMFALQNLPQEELELPGLKLQPIGSGQVSTKFDLEIGLRETSAGLRGGVGYATDLYDRSTVEEMTRRLVRVLEAVVEDGKRQIGQIDLLGPEERRQILSEWNNTERIAPKATLAELIESQVVRSPKATAVVYEDVSLSYEEMNERANRLENLLIEKGIGTEDVEEVAL